MKKKFEDEILRRLSEGESLITICKDRELPGRATVLRHLAENEEFQKAYEVARRAQAELIVDEIIAISDTANDRDSAAAARVKADARKWYLSKLHPKKYGEATLLKHAGPEGEKLELDDTARAVRLAAIFNDIQRRMK